jgi:hypothetical protein
MNNTRAHVGMRLRKLHLESPLLLRELRLSVRQGTVDVVSSLSYERVSLVVM